ncbi:MAG: hypothetical protein FJW40_19970 [Acidobacteria bacterium]|nr:hypothetical protein [Acidobacteriota bacterium]
MGDLMKGEQASARPQPSPPPRNPQGELRPDPVCGVFVPTSSPYRRMAGGVTHYFCSAECRDKHTA